MFHKEKWHCTHLLRELNNTRKVIYQVMLIEFLYANNTERCQPLIHAVHFSS
jgi:hypothetical protein